MTKPASYLIRMLIFCIAVYGVAVLVSPQLARFYMANPVIVFLNRSIVTSK